MRPHSRQILSRATISSQIDTCRHVTNLAGDATLLRYAFKSQVSCFYSNESAAVKIHLKKMNEYK